MSISLDTVPQIEIDRFWNQVNNRPEYFDPDYVVRAYRKSGLEVMPEPFDVTLIEPIIRALQNKTPFSVVRIGEGEANVLSWRAYVGMLNLDRHSIIINANWLEDTFRITDVWLSVMRDMMMNSVLEADMIGCRSLTNTIQHFRSAEDLKERTRNDLRGAVGIFRAVDYMLHLAKKKYLNGKFICSAHLYFNILEHLKILFQYSTQIICISPEIEIIEKMREKYPRNQFVHIEIGKQHPDGRNRSEPSFLVEVESKLQTDLQGILCLIGAGIWAEPYCTWVKRRGGVAVDIGSGFDLLAGRNTRPVHQEVLGETGKAYL